MLIHPSLCINNYTASNHATTGVGDIHISKYYKNNDLPLYKPIGYDMYHKIAKTTNIDLILPSNKNAQMVMLLMKSDKSKFFLFIFLVNSNARVEIKLNKFLSNNIFWSRLPFCSKFIYHFFLCNFA